MGTKYSKTYTMYTYDFDVKNNVRLVTLMNFLQDISTQHYNAVVKETGVGQGCAWVILEWKVDFFDLNLLEGDLVVTTEPTYFRRFIAYRAYEIHDLEGNLILKAISKWAFVDANEHKQVLLPHVFYDLFEVDEKAERPERLYRFNVNETETPRTCYRHTARYSDIDVNDHVNNVAYIRWMMDAVEKEYQENFEPASLWVSYKNEVTYNEEVTINSYWENETVKHVINDAEGNVKVKCALTWRAIQDRQ